MTPRVLLAVTALGLVSTAFGQTWRQLQPAAAPSPRSMHSMTWDGARERVVLFGGYEWNRDLHLRDHWEFDGTTWTQRTLTQTPPARQQAGMCFDERRGVIVLFGGLITSTFGTARYLQDTWEFDGTTWRQVAPVGAVPSARNASLAYDAQRGVTVLFGGVSNTSPYVHDDTWEYDGVRWTQRTVAIVPPGRPDYTTTYDARRGKVVAQPGYVLEHSTRMETWEWDGSLWAPTAAPNLPPPFVRPRVGYDARRGVAVLVGATFGSSQETWEYDGIDWRRVAVTSANVAIDGHALTYDVRHGALVLFGGSEEQGMSTVDSNETWEHATFASYTLFGHACTIAGRVPTLDAQPGSLPRTGETFVTEVRGLPPGAVPLLLAGRNTVSWGGAPLPFDLGIVGLPGCDLLTSGDLAVTLTNVGGTARWSLTIPAEPRLHGSVFHSQAFVADAALQPLGVTNGATARVGR